MITATVITSASALANGGLHTALMTVAISYA